MRDAELILSCRNYQKNTHFSVCRTWFGFASGDHHNLPMLLPDGDSAGQLSYRDIMLLTFSAIKTKKCPKNIVLFCTKNSVNDIIIPSSMDSGTAASDLLTPLCGLLSGKQVQLAA
jgi:hypothetical protein